MSATPGLRASSPRTTSTAAPLSAASWSRRWTSGRAGRPAQVAWPRDRGEIMKWLIVTGDDFGLHRGVTRGIIQAHRDGILTSASLMVNRPACQDAVPPARQWPGLSLGPHPGPDPG